MKPSSLTAPAIIPTDYPRHRAAMLPDETVAGRYVVRMARDAQDLDAILRLRYEVFNLELGEGLAESHQSGRDQDAFDAVCHHLLIAERETGCVVGTYRMQTAAMAAAGIGFYSAGEFDLSAVPAAMLSQTVELGRACIAKEHRSGRVLFLLWHGVRAYLAHNRMRYLFGCCSLTSQDPEEGIRMLRYLERHDLMVPGLRAPPLPAFACVPTADATLSTDVVVVPKLMRLYFDYGARICSAPALDRAFKTIDFLIWFDFEAMQPQLKERFTPA